MKRATPQDVLAEAREMANDPSVVWMAIVCVRETPDGPAAYRTDWHQTGWVAAVQQLAVEALRMLSNAISSPPESPSPPRSSATTGGAS